MVLFAPVRWFRAAQPSHLIAPAIFQELDVPHLALTLLGGFAATLDGQVLTAFGTDKARALLAYLAVEARRPQQRATLAALFWPDHPPAKAGHNLSQTLVRLRHALREDVTQPWLSITNQHVQLNPIGDYQLDVTRFTELLIAAQQHTHSQAQTCRTCLTWLAQAAELYRGDFLAGFALRDSLAFEEWQLTQQEALRRQAIEVLSRLAAYHDIRGEYELVQRYAGQLVSVDPWHEQGHLKLMRALALEGEAATALEKYAGYSRTLAEEFSLLPSAEMTTLFKQIQAGQLRPETRRPDAGRTAQHSERRQITALVCSRRDPTSLIDPEELHHRLTHCGLRCQPILERYGGHRQQHHGDGCLIYFGYPQAYEDAARRAVHAGLAVVEANRESDPVHVGIHTGIMVVVAQTQFGSTTHELVGNVPGVAHSCNALAAPGSVVMTADTERLIRGWFDYQSLGVQSLAGVPQALELHRVRGASTGQNHLAWLAQLQHLTPLVGRQREMAQMSGHLTTAVQGRGQIIAVRGESGMGKSRLIWELRQIDTSSATWLESRCLPYFQNTSLHPLINLVEQLLGFITDDDPHTKSARLTSALTRYHLDQPATAWLLALLLELPTDPPAPSTITTQQRERMREVFVSLVQRRAAEQPLVLVIEDLHWIDPSSLDWLVAFMEAIKTAPCLLVLNYRPTFIPPWLPRPYLHAFNLAPLNQAEVEQMVSNLMGATALPAEVRRRIAVQSDGTPLFIEELSKMLLEAGANLPVADVPATLQDSLLARLDRVGAARETAGWAAALGRDFAYPVLAAVVPYDEGRLQADLSSLAEAGLINMPRNPVAVYSFKHALIQEAAQAALLKRTRQEYHRRIAEMYAARFPHIAEAQPEVLAQHYAQAELPGKAVDWWLRAGEQASAQGATREAKTFFDRALASIGPHEHDRRWRALIGREKVLDFQGERAAQKADIAALSSLADETHNPVWQAETLVCRLKLLNATGEHAGIPSLADEVIRAARAAGQLGFEAHALCLKAAALTRLGEATAQQTAEEAVACGRAAKDEWAVAYASGMLALHAAYAGDYAQAAHLWGEVFEMVRRSGDRALESRALSNLGAAYQYLGQYEQARAYLEQGLALCDLIGDRRCHAYNVVNLGGVLMLSGDLQAARPLFEQGLAEALAVEDTDLRAGLLWEFGRISVMAGDYATAILYLNEARQLYAEMETIARVMETDALLAKCALEQHRPGEARALAGQVWDHVQKHGSIAMDEALPTYLTLAEVFEGFATQTMMAEDEASARAILEAANQLVTARAAAISDPAWRQSFLENVPSNRALIERWQRLRHSG